MDKLILPFKQGNYNLNQTAVNSGVKDLATPNKSLKELEKENKKLKEQIKDVI